MPTAGRRRLLFCTQTSVKEQVRMEALRPWQASPEHEHGDGEGETHTHVEGRMVIIIYKWGWGGGCIPSSLALTAARTLKTQ